MEDTLGSRIRYLRERKNLSQKELARQLKVSNVQLSRYESGDRTPDPGVITRVAHFFSVSTDFLLGLNSIKEKNSEYINDLDIKLLKNIKKVKGLESFIQSAVKHPHDFEKIQQIWEIITSNKT